MYRPLTVDKWRVVEGSEEDAYINSLNMLLRDPRPCSRVRDLDLVEKKKSSPKPQKRPQKDRVVQPEPNGRILLSKANLSLWKQFGHSDKRTCTRGSARI